MQAQQHQLKLIFRGRLEFGTERTYNMVLQHWQTRLETISKETSCSLPSRCSVPTTTPLPCRRRRS